MTTIANVATFLEASAPLALAAEWDNVGLLIGDRARPVRKIMTCLSVYPAVVAEAVAEQVDLIVTHHPFPFKPLKRVTTDSVEGRMLLDLAAARVAVYSAHTAFDSASEGINQQLAAGLGLSDVAVLVPPGPDSPAPDSPVAGQGAIDASASKTVAGTGRMGRVPAGTTLGKLARTAAQFLKLPGVQIVGSAGQPIQRVAIACGSAGELLHAAVRQGCDCFVTGESRFHGYLEAEATGITLLLLGHYASERFGMEQLARQLAGQFPDLNVWASRQERDPVSWVEA